MAAEGSSTSASDAASAASQTASQTARNKAAASNPLPPPSSPSSVLRRKMATQRKDPVPPRRPGAAGGGGSGAGAASAASTTNTTTRPPSSASRPLASSTARLVGTGSSLNKPPTRAPAGTAARRTALGTAPNKPAQADDNKKPAVRRTIGAASTAGSSTAGRATPSERRSTIAPSTAAKRPSTTSTTNSTATTTTTTTARATPRASLPPSTSKTTTTPSRPSVTTRTPQHTIPKAPVSTITPKTPVAHAKKLSINSLSSPTKAAHADSAYSPIHVPPRSYGPLKDKAASDAEVELKVNKTIPFGPLKETLPNLGEDERRPGTAPSGPAEVDEETQRRSLAVMQDFFQETTLREKLQEQCDDLHHQVDVLHSTNTKLRKQLLDAQNAITEKDEELAGAATDPNAWDENKHNTIVNGMEKKFALETKLLEEQKQKLGEEKRVAQEKEAAEAAKAAELQQVLDDLNVELERQGREWDAEKLQLVEQGAKIEVLTNEITTLKAERDSLSANLATANTTLEGLQTKLSELEKSHADEVRDRDGKIESLTKTVETLRTEITTAEQRLNDASDEAKQSLEAKSSESTKLVEELQAKVASLQQQHTDQLRKKDQALASHAQVEKELRHDLTKLQQRADQTTADLENERTAHSKDLKAQIAKMQESNQQELNAKESDISGHLKSIEDLQNQIATLQQGETDGARVSQELTKQIQELKAAHDESIKLKSDQNDDLVQQLQSVNEQVNSDAAEIRRFKDEADGLRKTVQSLEQTAKQDNTTHATALDNLQKELSDAKKKAETNKADLEAAQDRHRQDLRVLGEDHDAEIDSLRADLEGDAKRRLDKLQAEYDALVAEKNAALEGHEKNLADRAGELEEAQQEIRTLKESSGTTSQSLDEAIAKHKKVAEEKNSLAEAHLTAQKHVAHLEARVETLIKENGLIAELNARIDAMTEDKQAASETLAISEESFNNLKAELDTSTEEKRTLEEERTNSVKALTHARDELEASLQDRQYLEDKYTELDKELKELKAQHSSLLEAKSAMEETHARTVDALKQDSESVMKQALSELQSKHDTLLEETRNNQTSRTSELGDVQARCDALVKKLAEVESKLEESEEAQKTAETAQSDALQQALEVQRQEIEQKYETLLEDVQADCTKLEQHMDEALAEKRSALDEFDQVQRDLHAQIDHLKRELARKEELDSAGLAEVSKTYETLLADQVASDKKSHKAAMDELRQALTEQHERAEAEAHAELESLRKELVTKENTDSAGLVEVTEKYEALLAEQSAADKRDHEAELALLKDSLDTDIHEAKERYEALLAEKEGLRDEHERATDKARVELDELRQQLKTREQSEDTELSEIKKKHAALLAERTATDEAHEAALLSLKQSHEREREHAIAELESQNRALQDTFAKMDEEHQQTLATLRKGLEADHSSDANALRQQLERSQREHTEATDQMVKAHDEAISELIVGMQNSAADAVQQLQKKHAALEAEMESVKASHSAELETIKRESTEQHKLNSDLQARFDKVVVELESSSEDVKRLQDTIEAIETERDRAYKAATEAEDRIETFKGEVVRKHLARVEPLQKENTALMNKIDRLQDMLAAGDRIARAAASLGERREMTTLAEESDEEQNSSASAGSAASAAGVPRAAPLLNGAAKDVVGTVSVPRHESTIAILVHNLTEHQQLAAMQETLSQLSALNNDAIAESERTAQRLTERD